MGGEKALDWLVLEYLQGLGARDAWSPPNPSAATTCTRKGVTCYELRGRKGTYHLQVLQNEHQKSIVSRLLIPDIQQLVYWTV